MSLDTIIGVVKRSICSISMIYNLTINDQIEIEAYCKMSLTHEFFIYISFYFRSVLSVSHEVTLQSKGRKLIFWLPWLLWLQSTFPPCFILEIKLLLHLVLFHVTFYYLLFFFPHRTKCFEAIKHLSTTIIKHWNKRIILL
jgi:hypothetical protein